MSSNTEDARQTERIRRDAAVDKDCVDEGRLADVAATQEVVCINSLQTTLYQEKREWEPQATTERPINTPLAEIATVISPDPMERPRGPFDTRRPPAYTVTTRSRHSSEV